MKIALCLSGGGIKGAAHVGALKAFEEENIDFEYISGTSSGSIVATLYSVGYQADDIYKLFQKYAKKIKYFDIQVIWNIIKRLVTERKFIIEGLNSGKIIEKIINEACANKNINNINQIKKKLLVPSVDLENGTIYFFSSMLQRSSFNNQIIYVNDINIGKAVRASCSYPGVFCPCQYKNRKLVDGGIRENMPWKEWKNSGVDKVICIGFETEKKNKKDKNIIDIVANSLDLLCYELSNYELEGVDYLLKIHTKEVSLLEIKEMEYLYKMGYEQTKKFLENMKNNFV